MTVYKATRKFGRRLILAALPLSLVLSVAVATPAAHPSQAAAVTSCVRVIGGVFNPKGPDDFMPWLDGEYVTLHNYCGTSADMSGWKVTDLSQYNFMHVFTFPAGYQIGAFRSIFLRSGTGTNTAVNVYWQRPECAVWNNSAPERAFLRTPSWAVVSSWSPYP
ncbi:MAG: lamin tail domain-containing protein [Chloroflexota bacterium]|nr:lamin tail domain-containing protein [Chloroflexota bacterium]